MNAFKSALATVLLAASLAPAHATVINFNGLAGTSVPGGTDLGNHTYFAPGSSLIQSGFKFVGAGADHLIGPVYSGGDSGVYAYNDTDYLIALAAVTISNAAGTPFTINSLDLKKWSDTTVLTQTTLTGVKAGGGTVVQVITLDTAANATVRSGNDFKNYLLSGFDSLSSLTISNNGNYYLAMDNLVFDVAPVPEPASLALFGIALAGGAFVRRRAGRAV